MEMLNEWQDLSEIVEVPPWSKSRKLFEAFTTFKPRQVPPMPRKLLKADEAIPTKTAIVQNEEDLSKLVANHETAEFSHEDWPFGRLSDYFDKFQFKSLRAISHCQREWSHQWPTNAKLQGFNEQQSRIKQDQFMAIFESTRNYSCTSKPQAWWAFSTMAKELQQKKTSNRNETKNMPNIKRATKKPALIGFEHFIGFHWDWLRIHRKIENLVRIQI